MKSTKALVLAFCVCGATNSSLAQDLLWRNLANGNTTSDDSKITVGYDSEVADDFDVMGSVERVVLSGYSCFNSCSDGVVVIAGRRGSGGGIPGDMNCDDSFNGGDIDPFFLALGDPAAYQTAFPNCDPLNGDINRMARSTAATSTRSFNVSAGTAHERLAC